MANNTPENFEALARLITSDPPSWLYEFLQHWTSTLTLSWAVEKRQPSRVEMLKILDKVAAAAALLTRALGEAAVCEFLDVNPEVPLDASALSMVTNDIHWRAKQGKQSDMLTDVKGKAKSGRGPALPEKAILSQTFCALFIAEVVKHFAGDYPRPRNRKAAEAAEILWRIAGAERSSWGAEPVNAWRRHFTKALSPDVAELPEEVTCRSEIRRHLRIWTQMSQEGGPPGAGDGRT